jgi:antitoxin component YwqK of YwqJK toxin-antitoxin module
MRNAKLNVLCLGAALLGAVELANSQENPNDYLTYAIPADAQRKQISVEPDSPNQFNYYDALNHIVAIEMLGEDTKKLLERKLYKNDQLHGVQLTWYRSGSPQSSKPYRNGEMNGVFRYWDEQGRLIGCSPMLKGTGVDTVYFPNGRVKEIKEFKDNQQSGDGLLFYSSGQLEAFTTYKDGHQVGETFLFHEDGALMVYVADDGKGNPRGPRLEFTPEGQFASKTFIIYVVNHTAVVSQDVYVATAQKDSSLPAFHDDPHYYIAKVPESLKQLTADYKAKKPVPIPLKDIADDKLN